MVAVETVHAVYVKIANRPGTLESTARALAQRHVNIEAVSLETLGETGIARILTHKGREAVEALRNSGIEAYESELVLVSVPNRTGELSRITSELSAAQLNLEGLLTTPDGRLAFRTNDNERAAQILRKL